MGRLLLTFFEKTTEVVVQPGALNHIGEWVANLGTPPIVLVCSDRAVAKLYSQPVLNSLASADIPAVLHTIPPGDASKSLAELDRIYRKLGEIGLARDGLLLALGGGVVSDLTGFAAATWMRGVRFAVCPTTLEADVDASIGGKTGINHAAGKNMVGAFHQPDLVAVDPECLRTLPAREISAGLAESIKHALIRDADLLSWHEERVGPILGVEPVVMAELIERNQRIKAAVVEADVQERTGLRALLNFGHTIGHAVEKWTSYELRHGEAVALGMVAAARISRAMGLLSQADVERIVAVLRAFKLPVRSPQPLDVDAVARFTRSDKKVHKHKRRWVLLQGIGQAILHENVDDVLIRKAIEQLNDDPQLR